MAWRNLPFWQQAPGAEGEGAKGGEDRAGRHHRLPRVLLDGHEQEAQGQQGKGGGDFPGGGAGWGGEG